MESLVAFKSCQAGSIPAWILTPAWKQKPLPPQHRRESRSINTLVSHFKHPAALFCNHFASLGFNRLTRSFPSTYWQLKAVPLDDWNLSVSDRIPNEPHMCVFTAHFPLWESLSTLTPVVLYQRECTLYHCYDFRDKRIICFIFTSLIFLEKWHESLMIKTGKKSAGK